MSISWGNIQSSLESIERKFELGFVNLPCELLDFTLPSF